MKQSLAHIRETVADLLFPRECVGCGKEETFFCDRCLRTVPRKREHDCPFCRAMKTPSGRTCLRCAPKHALDGLFAATIFRESGAVAEAVHALKYEFVPELASPLGRLLAEELSRADLPLPDMIIPVPLHPWRQRWRGFNQAERIATTLAESLAPGLPIPLRTDLLIRHRFTLPQARAEDAKRRKQNLASAFSTTKHPATGKEVRGKTVWLVDDVATTGTTLIECARVLKRSGAKRVFGIVVAR